MLLNDESINYPSNSRDMLIRKRELEVWVDSGKRLATQGAVVSLACAGLALSEVVHSLSGWVACAVGAGVFVLGLLKIARAKKKLSVKEANL